MAYWNKNVSDESSVNIQYSWAEQVARMLQAINFHNILCQEGHYENCKPMFSYLIGLIDFVESRIDTTDVINNKKEVTRIGLDKQITDVKTVMKKFNMRGLQVGVIADAYRKKKGEEIHDKLRTLYRSLMDELSHHGILQYIKLNVKEMAKQQWYGDANGEY